MFSDTFDTYKEEYEVVDLKSGRVVDLQSFAIDPDKDEWEEYEVGDLSWARTHGTPTRARYRNSVPAGLICKICPMRLVYASCA